MKQLTFLLLSFLIAVPGFAFKKEKTIELGIVTGTAIFQYQTDKSLIDYQFNTTEINASAKSVFHVGFLGNYFLYSHLSLDLDLYYTAKNVGIDRKYNADNIQTESSFSSLSITPGAKYYFMEIFYAGGGFFFNIPLSNPKILNTTVSDSSYKPEFGLFLDFGITLPIAEKIDLFGGLRANLAFTGYYENTDLKKLNPADNINDSCVESLNTQFLSLMVGITYRIDL